MNAKQKAKQIINQFQTELMYTYERSIYASLVCVDIILKEAAENPVMDFEYWTAVHKEIKSFLN